ncbi:chromate transporter [Humitalea sp. 24SJ18S-53]|uniref:chromate transporter n=1 Tax=Humitalea sp. 24SJ18S-53 TaxID=3422307 RepID=UPI003D671361
MTPPPLNPPPRPIDLLLAYAKASCLGFGGANVWCRRVIVEERRWMTERDYAEVLGIGQVLPGPNVGNAAVMIGRRFCGAWGAIAGSVGLYGPPLLALMAFALAWDRFSAVPGVAAFMHGVAAAAAGLVIGNAARQAGRLGLTWDLLALLALAAIAAAFWQLPLLLILAVVGPAGIAAVVWRGRGRV